MLVGAAVWIAGSAVLSVVAPPTTEVVVATTDLAAGTVLGPADVELRRWPVDLAPDGPVPADRAVGATLASAVGAGLPITATAVAVSPAAPRDDDRVHVVAGLVDAWSASLVAPGSEVDVHLPTDGWTDGWADGSAEGSDVASGTGPGGGAPAPVLAERAVVVRVLGAPAGDGGILGGADPAGDGAALVLAVTPAEGRRLAAVAGRGVALTVPPPSPPRPRSTTSEAVPPDG